MKEIEFEEWNGQQRGIGGGLDESISSIGPDPPMGTLERLEQTKRKAHEALQRQWKREAASPKHKPERMMRYTITIDCTWSEFQAIKDAIKGFAPGRKWNRQEEIPRRGRTGG